MSSDIILYQRSCFALLGSASSQCFLTSQFCLLTLRQVSTYCGSVHSVAVHRSHSVRWDCTPPVQHCTLYTAAKVAPRRDGGERGAFFPPPAPPSGLTTTTTLTTLHLTPSTHNLRLSPHRPADPLKVFQYLQQLFHCILIDFIPKYYIKIPTSGSIFEVVKYQNISPKQW